MKLSKRADSLKPSPTMAMAAKARALAEQGHKVINLTLGEPDWATVKSASDAAIVAIQKGQTKYSAASGVIELRKAIAASTNKHLLTQYTADEVAVGAGAKYVIFSALQLLVDPGDEVIIPAPYWVSYPTMAELAGAKVKIINCDQKDNFKLSAERLRSAISPLTKVLILCSPSNPTGLSYTLKELKELAKVLLDHPQVTVISDDIYNALSFADGLAPHLLQAEPKLLNQVLVVNGASKSFAMTGWRVGWACGPKSFISRMSDFFSQSTSNVATPSQYAVLAAIETAHAEVEEARRLLRQRREKALSGFAGIKGLQVIPPDGAFYLWVDISKFIGQKISGQTVNGSKDFCELLLTQYHVATVPGLEFGTEGYIRLSFAVSEGELLEAIARFKKLAEEVF